jgi:hypothetical protein
MPANDPGAYQNMTSEQLMSQIDAELEKLGVPEGELGSGPSGAEDIVDLELEGEQIEKALMDAEDPAPSDTDAEAALGAVLASGVSDPSSIMSALRDQGFDIVRVGAPETPMEEPQEGEVSMSDARSKAVENAMGGTA